MTTKGFTLIEIVMYLALFSIIIGGSIVAAYSIIESSGKNQTKTILLEEGLFISSKIESIIRSSVLIVEPSLGSFCAQMCKLSVTTHDGEAITVTHFQNALHIDRDGAAMGILNNSLIRVTSFTVNHLQDKVEVIFSLSLKTPQGQLITSSFSAYAPYD